MWSKVRRCSASIMSAAPPPRMPTQSGFGGGAGAPAYGRLGDMSLAPSTTSTWWPHQWQGSLSGRALIQEATETQQGVPGPPLQWGTIHVWQSRCSGSASVMRSHPIRDMPPCSYFESQTTEPLRTSTSHPCWWRPTPRSARSARLSRRSWGSS